MKRTNKILSALLCFALLCACVSGASAVFRDIDADGETTAQDARLVLRAALELETLTDEQKAAADTDGDGEVTAQDARVVLRTALGMETEETGQKPLSEVKIGLITLNDENSSFDKAYFDGVRAAQASLGLSDEQIVFKTNVPEDEHCYEAAKELANACCDVVFANSFGHEDYMIRAAKEFPDVDFCHVGGTKAHTEGLKNFHNAFAAVYQGRFLTGVAAGMKLNEMIESGRISASEAKIGYVGAFPFAEVKSGYTAFFLGARSVCPSATMEVNFISAWYSETMEREIAKLLIKDNCVLISQHNDSPGAPTACEEAGVPNVSYGGSTKDVGPNSYLISCAIDWEPYFEYVINAAANGEDMPADWTGTLETGSVKLCELNESVAAPGTAEKLEEVSEQIKTGALSVFDTSAFTVDGQHIDNYLANVDFDSEYKPDTQVIVDGRFAECEYRSAPYFDLDIDGIEFYTY